MLAESGLLHALERHAFSTGGQPLCIYGDPAYPLRVHLQGPFQGAALTPQMEMFNGSMSSVRVSVEWLFGDILNYFKFLDFKKNLKVGLSNIGKTYVVCALMRNALTCLYGNQTSEFFELDPPSLQEYFRWPKNIRYIYLVTAWIYTEAAIVTQLVNTFLPESALGGGGRGWWYFRIFCVGVSCWDPGTLNLYQS